MVRRGQLELPIERPCYQDRNADKGGRSFYFFDFDDNVAFLTTPAYLFHRETGEELLISSGEFAQLFPLIGQSGHLASYRIDLCDNTGTFRNFRDQNISDVEKAMGRRQVFVQDLAAALGLPDVHWKGPSWSCFVHATLNQRPTSIITARGHHPETIKEGIGLMVENRHLPKMPNFLSIYPVSHPEIRLALGDHQRQKTVPELKRAAIRASVEQAIQKYGYSPHHRFGMSDDDPQNIQLIFEEMTQLKKTYPEMSFFVIETQHGKFTKWEVYADHLEPLLCADSKQLAVFDQLSLLDD